MFLLALATTAAATQTQLDELIARAKSFELDTRYVPRPGDPLVSCRDALILGRRHPAWAQRCIHLPDRIERVVFSRRVGVASRFASRVVVIVRDDGET